MQLRRASIEQRLQKARNAWMKAMSEFQDERGLVHLPVPPMLEDRHLANCRVLASRDSVIGLMPRGGRIAEVGVLARDFSRVLLDKSSPAELHLVDLDLQSHGIS